MKTKTEGDIPELFQQFNGNSANYQELTRAAAARASQARWPLLSAVDLEQGDIPAVMDAVTGLAVVEPVLLEVAREVALDAQEAALSVPETQVAARHDEAEVDAIPAATPLAEAVVDAVGEADTEADGAVDLATDADVDAADSRPEMPSAVVLPGNTIFMAPAPYSARHFAQLERGLVARREAALAEIVASTQAFHAEPSLESLLASTQEAAIAETAPVADTGGETASASFLAPKTEVALTETARIEVIATESVQMAAPAVAVTTAVVEPNAIRPEPEAATTPADPASVTAMPTALTATPATVTAARQPITRQPITRQPITKQPAKQPAKPARNAATSAAHAPKAASVTPAAATVASATPATPAAPVASDANPAASSAAKHTGLKPLFERLAEPEAATTPVISLFSRLMQS